ncbi:diheme cytochrome SoxA (sulfur oxidation) (plasmid) [Allomeiothermus silvanus DSM 9946]|uniref:SoxAX cytochrome complex subunit A n=1 Tax=Allomeiothermus silvanus (strain ATCC 700542 / DSM 9946 / NBRC 106475 / NCIMB 13440 / VI-R2) TaxID=526227 RepID=D7BJA1_ALLS1|nr:sulfur oxidation c-type cytochrome SoxA [Allomeiothermus silvanus]ADH65257.1 diheme cytochrome SoxA (sulfur oxidation) [Allomeiothermus silvanus DSM 9946]
MRKSLILTFLLSATALFALSQQEKPLDPFEEAMKQRQQYLQNFGILPGDLFASQGEELFHAKRGPKGKSLEECDFGLGPGKLEGAYARLPRYFPDTGKVEDLETRIVSCMERIQGFKPEVIKRDEVVALTTFVASKSTKAKIAVRPQHPAELAMYTLGRELWYTRAGPRDMSCAICHDNYAGKRVRLSPVMSPKQGLGSEWPAYRFEEDRMYTFENRIQFCYTSVGIPAPAFYSEPQIALTMYILTEASKAGHSFQELPFFTR